ncbi:MAG: hypothetical protein J6Q89_07635 [Clostridia bacterium]|nr:hypothetical protein [Clostridia bacterium]
MVLYEIYKSDIKKYGSIEKVIKSGDYISRDNMEDFIKNAFNFGHGTKKDFNEHMKNNKALWIWYDPKTKRQITKI